MAALPPLTVGTLHLPGLDPVPVFDVPLSATAYPEEPGRFGYVVSAGALRLTREAAEVMRQLLDTFPEQESS